MIGFASGDRIRHLDQGEGRVVLSNRENVGIHYDNGNVGCYGASFFERFPSAIVNLRPPAEPKTKMAEEDRAYLHPEDF